MADDIKQNSDDVPRLFVLIDDYYAEKTVVVNEDGSPISSGGSGGEGLTDTQLRATPVPISAAALTTIAAALDINLSALAAALESIMVVGPLNNTELRASAVPVSQETSTTPGQNSVANAITNGTLLAANGARKGSTIFNDDSASTGATLKIKLGATSSASSFTYAIPPQGYYEVPFNYTGIITGIASAATGNARITELT